MALLLAMYQKMKLIREINQDTLKLTRISSKLDRVTKNIEKTQKRFTSLFAQLDQQAQRMQSNATLVFQQMSGLGMNNFANSVNPYGFNGMNGFIMEKMNGLMTSSQFGVQYKDDAGNVQYWGNISQDTLAALWANYNQNGGFAPLKEEDEQGNLKTVYRTASDDGGLKLFGVGNDSETIPKYEGFRHEDVLLFNQAMQQAKMQQQQAQMWVQNANMQYGQNVSIWLDAAKAQLEAEQDAALEPLNYEDTMLQLEKEQLDSRLQRLRAEKESYDQLVGEEAKNMAPTFGLR